MTNKWKTLHREEAITVEEHLRAIIKNDRKRFAEHPLSDSAKQNFQLLLSRFCRKFSTLAAESFKNNIPFYRKAGFLIVWMKLLSNFHPGKTLHERILQNTNHKFDQLSVHRVLMNVIHENVYSLIHKHEA